jgi:hypothetical protein
VEPSDLKSDHRTERFARVQVGPTCLVESASHFGEAQNDDEDPRAGDENCQRAQCARESGKRRGKTENSAADDAVDDSRGESPAANCPYELRQIRVPGFTNLTRRQE